MIKDDFGLSPPLDDNKSNHFWDVSWEMGSEKFFTFFRGLHCHHSDSRIYKPSNRSANVHSPTTSLTLAASIPSSTMPIDAQLENAVPQVDARMGGNVGI